MRKIEKGGREKKRGKVIGIDQGLTNECYRDTLMRT